MNTSKYQKSRRDLAAVVCAAFIAALSAPASATDLVGPDVTVQYGNVSIETERGASQLLKRIEAAASRVCAPLNHGDLVSRANAQACSQKLTAAAIARVNHPMLLAAYQSTGQVSPDVANLTK
jgi:UrcA family protein